MKPKELVTGRINCWRSGLKKVNELKDGGWLPVMDMPGKEFCGRPRFKLGCRATVDEDMETVG